MLTFFIVMHRGRNMPKRWLLHGFGKQLLFVLRRRYKNNGRFSNCMWKPTEQDQFTIFFKLWRKRCIQRTSVIVFISNTTVNYENFHLCYALRENKYKNTKRWWLGLIRPCNQTEVKKESFMWIDNSTNDVYNWAAKLGEPNDEDHYCTCMTNRLTWSDADCGTKLNYVCQLKRDILFHFVSSLKKDQFCFSKPNRDICSHCTQLSNCSAYNYSLYKVHIACVDNLVYMFSYLW